MEPSLWRMLTSLGDTDIGLEDLRDIGDVLLGSGEGGMGESGGMLAKYLWKRNVSQSQTDIGYVDVNQKKYLSWHWFWCSESIYHPKFSWYITLRWHQFSLLMTLTIQKLFTRLTYVFKKFSHTTNELWYAYSFYTWLYLARYSQLASWLQIQSYIREQMLAEVCKQLWSFYGSRIYTSTLLSKPVARTMAWLKYL